MLTRLDGKLVFTYVLNKEEEANLSSEGCGWGECELDLSFFCSFYFFGDWLGDIVFLLSPPYLGFLGLELSNTYGRFSLGKFFLYTWT